MCGQYVAFKRGMIAEDRISELLKKFSLEGTEIYADDIISRDERLTGENMDRFISECEALKAKRIHCAYWANPTSFLLKEKFKELIGHFGSLEAVKEYYGDLSGTHYIERLADEYEACCRMKCSAYTFHLIDYAPVDGLWEFTIPREEICTAMISFLNQFMVCIYERGLLSGSSPLIELENAGWGLEYGTQTASDYARVLDEAWDPFGRLRVSWDINHLLHAVGYDSGGKAAFLLPDDEITPDMRKLEELYGENGAKFAAEWIRHNLFGSRLKGKAASIQLADCVMKSEEYFRRGKLTGKYYEEISALRDWNDREEYGVSIVLGHYDSHVPVGYGILNGEEMGEVLREFVQQNPGAVIVHELKNSSDILADLKKQTDSIK